MIQAMSTGPLDPAPDLAPDAVPERIGYAFMVGSSLCFAAMGVLVKQATETLPFHEVSFFRSLGGLVITVGAMALAGIPFALKDPGLLVWRGVMGWASLTSYFLAISSLHLADAVLLNYTSPFFTALLAALWLGEKLTRRTVMCLAGATVGVAFVVGPQGAFWQWGTIAALGSALFAGLAYVAVKRANASNSPWMIVAGFSLVATLLTLPMLAFSYRTPAPGEWWQLAGVAALGTVAQLLMTYGYRFARASTASVITLFTPLLAAGFSIAFFGAAPSWGTWVGAALIIGAGAWLATAPTPGKGAAT